MKLELDTLNYCGTVVQLSGDDLFKLDNCDNLIGAKIFGNNILVGKDTMPGATGVFFPVECKLSDKFLHTNNLYSSAELNADNKKKGYFPNNGRVRAISLRGNRSEGIFLPVNTLTPVCGAKEHEFKVGDSFNKINGITVCEKYVVPIHEPSVPNPYNRTKKVKLSDFILPDHFKFHYDTHHLGRLVDTIKDCDLITITEKFHGTSAIIGNCLVKKQQSKFREKLNNFLGIPNTRYSVVGASRMVIKYMEGVKLGNYILDYRAGFNYDGFMKTLFGSLEDGTRFSFDGTEEDFIRQAVKAGLRLFGSFSGKVYLHNGEDSTLLTIYRNEWLDKLSCACVVSHAPLRALLARRGIVHA